MHFYKIYNKHIAFFIMIFSIMSHISAKDGAFSQSSIDTQDNAADIGTIGKFRDRSKQDCKKLCKLSHIITLGLADSSFTPLPSQTFDITLGIVVNGPLVTITIPSINFILPVSGFVYTSANNLPKFLWPTNTVPPASFLAVDGTPINLQAYIYSDGTLRIKSLGETAIPAGTYSTNTLTFTYRIPCPKLRAPHNVKISERSSNILGTITNERGGDYGDALRNDIRADRVAFCWNQTIAGVPQDQKTVQLVVCTGKIESGELELNEPVIAYTPPDKKDTFDSAVLIDPKNLNHLVAATTEAAGLVPEQIVILNSFDFGKTWKAQPGPIAGGITPQPNVAISEQRILFDHFGNLYLSFFIFSLNPSFDQFRYS